MPIVGSNLTDDVKAALVDCFQNVAWENGTGEQNVTALQSALYPVATAAQNEEVE
jgi:hypothetical protein